ncbi:putative ABC transporter [Trypanosoma grayi]|uniref:putative ABC transporter n=1 Tax=Trypanosoma grayi TaxID=71804 RepID=UPI0004F416B6|nr:putative ABC transporter [Trypanosoma grayi]KEG13107.1 putative ABC transporter [Trypanosoma grayi]
MAQGDSLYESRPTDATGYNCNQRVWLFLCQTATFIWKEYLDRVRHPRRAVAELLAPALVVAMLLYAVNLSPVVWVEPFQYTSLPTATFSAGIPNESAIAPTWRSNFESVGKWRDVFEELNMTSFFFDYALSVASMRNVTSFHTSTSRSNDAWSDSWSEDDVVRTLLTNRYAAAPFKVPTLDGYAAMLAAAQVAIGERGMKRAMRSDALIRFILRFGKLAFAVGGGGGDDLARAAEKIVEYLNATTKSFNSMVLCKSSILARNEDGCVFDSVEKASPLLADYMQQQQLQGQREELVWAIVRVDRVTLQPPDFRYVILVNQAMLPTWTTIETFPQGLGKEYAMYVYNGFLTLQYELNAYFISLAGLPRRRMNLSLTPLMDFVCDAVETPHNATRGLFEEPESSEQRDIVENATTQDPIVTTTAEPFTAVSAIYAPCLYEVGAYCGASNDTKSILECLTRAENETVVSGMCQYALEFIQECVPNDNECGSNNAYELLTQVPSALPDCAESRTASCGAKEFLRQVEKTKTMMGCTVDLPKQFRSSNMPRDAFYTNFNLPREKETAAGDVSDDCRTLSDTVRHCSDEFLSICPIKWIGGKGIIPYACLYVNQRFLSTSCKTTSFVKNVLPFLYSNKALRETVPAATYYCREVHDIHKTLVDSIVMQAFPTDGYTQRMFFLTGSPFVGLMVSIAYYFPFAVAVHSFAKERDAWQHRYLILIGANPIAMLLSKFLVSFITSTITSLMVTFVMMFCVDIPSSAVYSLLYMYYLSLSALAAVVGILVPWERVAIIVTPFVLFLFVTPALVGEQLTQLSGVSTLLPPTVLAKAINEYTRAAQAGYLEVMWPHSSQKALWILFGLFLLYGLIAIVLEYLFLPNSALERVFRRFTTSLVTSVDRLLRSGNRQMTKFYEGEEMTTNHTVAPPRQEGDIQLNQEASNLEFNIGGVSSKDTEATRRQHTGETGFLLGGILREDLPSVPGEIPPSLMSSTAQGYQSRSYNEGVLPVPSNWHPGITVRDLSYTALGQCQSLQVPSADFYQNRLNCVVGGDASGWSLLLNVLMGWSEPPQGDVRVDGRSIRMDGRGEIGVCLERNVFWDKMTVRENIRLIQLLKGRLSSLTELKDEENVLLTALQLESVRHERPGRLSAGVARKLAIAMALAGGSRTLFFNEPTAHTDLSSRSEIWHLLSQNTRGRCIVVSTSDVDEVDAFADHVTVLFGGRVSIAGTPEYIRWKLSGGWVVTVCCAVNTHATTVLDLVMSAVPDAILVNNVGHEISFRLTENVEESALPTLLRELQRAKDSALVTNISVSDSRFSEGYVRLTRELGRHQPVRTDEEETTRNVAGDNYVMMPPPPSPSTHNNLDEQEDGGVPLDISEERESRQWLMFLGTCRAVLNHRLFEALLTPFHCMLVTLLPLVMILYATATLGRDFGTAKFSETSVFGWQLSSIPSSTYYSDFGGAASPYRFLSEQLQGKHMSGTVSSFSTVDKEEVASMQSNSAGLDSFLRNTSVPKDKFLFGAFAMQGAVVKAPKDIVPPAVFPWQTDVVLCNTSFPLSVPAYLQMLGMMRLWMARNDTEGAISAFIGTLKEAGDTSEGGLAPPTTSAEVMSTLLLLLPFAFYGTRMVADLVQQRRSGLLQVFYSSSLRPLAFWLANFTYDFLSFFTLAFVGVVIFSFSSISRDVTVGDFFALLGILIIFGCGTISLSYLISKCFDDHTAAQAVATAVGICTGFAFQIVSSAVRFLPDNPMAVQAREKNEVNSIWMRFFPLFNLGEAFMTYSMASIPFSGIDVAVYLQPLALLPLLFVTLVAYETVAEVNARTLIRDKVWRFFEKLNVKIVVRLHRLCGNYAPIEDGDLLYRWEDPSCLLTNEDASVGEERNKEYTADGLRVEALWKRQHNVYALQNVTMNVEGETLIVVGVNGSGKTTLLRCVAGEILPSHGSVFVNGVSSTRRNMSKLKAQSFVGYASETLVLQHSTITPYLFLNIMADLRLLRRGTGRKHHLRFLMRTLGIEPYMHVGMWVLSSSLHRRVTLAAALVGYPSVLILDDVTSSLDPVARRQVWAALRSVPQGTSTVLSTRHPDDVEMVGDRVLLLDEGNMRYIGTPVAWRGKYRKGLSVSIDVSRPHEVWISGRPYNAAEQEALCNFFAAHWRGSTLIESRPFHYVFHIPLGANQDDMKVGSEVISIYTVLATLIKGRDEGWTVSDAVEGDVGGSRRHCRCSITVSETTIEHTVRAALSQSIAFTSAVPNLFDRNVYIPPKDYRVVL